jgi:hypothetical protein
MEAVMNGLFDFLKLYDQDDSAGDPPPPPEDSDKLPDAWTKEQQDEFNKRAGALRKSAAEKAKAEAKAELEAAQKKAQEEADKKALADQGKFKEAAELAEKAKLEAENKVAQAEAEARTLKRKEEFREAADELDVQFISQQAAKDAFAFIPDDAEDVKKALEDLQKSRPYLFGTDDEEETPRTDAREKGKRPTSEQLDKVRSKELVSKFRIRTPR